MPGERHWRQRWQTLGELLRISNLPTAWADIACGWLVSTRLRFAPTWSSQELVGFVGLLLASSGLYLSGMAWNDYFDAARDAVERPSRPIPSGRTRRVVAAWVAAGLMLIGLLTAGLTAWAAATAWPIAIAGWLAFLILAYDGLLKQNLAGPVILGLCRFTNVLLGAALAAEPFSALMIYLATTNGVYITGVSYLARNEVGKASRVGLLIAGGLIAIALAMSATTSLPVFLRRMGADWTVPAWQLALWWAVFVWWGFKILRTMLAVLRSPQPWRIQLAVGQFLAGVIVLDTLLAAAIVGPMGYVIALLVLPARWLRRHFPPT